MPKRQSKNSYIGPQTEDLMENTSDKIPEKTPDSSPDPVQILVDLDLSKEVTPQLVETLGGIRKGVYEATVMDKDIRGLSLRLNDVMDGIGASESMRKVHQDTSITSDIVKTLLHGNSVSIYTFGSSCEGATTPGLESDVDTVLCCDFWPVTDDIHEAPANGISYLMIRDEHPGYVKLQIVSNARPKTLFDRPIHNESEDADDHGNICLKHKMFHIGRVNLRHGPAATQLPRPGFGGSDEVMALRCRKIPPFANEWVSRRRSFEWPSRHQLKKMGSLGCFLVCVGHPSSHKQQIEWRLSFSLQERELMFSLNPTQHKCYVLLKVIKKDLIEKTVGQSISSYHCKTCIFYIIENTSADKWKPKNLFHCVRLCLYVLWVWVYRGNCPNYFVREENMFDKIDLISLRIPLLRILYDLLTSGYRFLFDIKCDRIGFLLMNIGKFQYRQIKWNMKHVDKMRFERKFNLIRKVLEYRNKINKDVYKINDYKQAVLKCLNTLQYLMALNNVTEHTEQQIKEAVAYVIPFVRLLLAQHLAVIAIKVEGVSVIRQLVQFCDLHFPLCNNVDTMAARLMMATVFLRLKKYDMCEHILKQLSMDVNDKVISHCRCCSSKQLDLTNSCLEVVSGENISSKLLMESYVATCVQFPASHTEIIPPPLRLEMYRSVDTFPGSQVDRDDYWFDWVVVDGKVYVYVLQYLLYSQLNKTDHEHAAIEKLKFVIQDDTNLSHTETGYNILGWIYTHNNMIEEAVSCFRKSWAIRPYHNAAKLHIRNLILNIFRHHHYIVAMPGHVHKCLKTEHVGIMLTFIYMYHGIR